MSSSAATPSSLAARVVAVTERLRDQQAKDLADWADLYRLLGRAQQAAVKGDLAELRQRLQEAADAEYALLLDCDATGELIEVLDDDPSAPTAPPTESCPPPRSLTFSRDRLLYLLEQAARLARSESSASVIEIADRVLAILEASS